MASIGEVDGLDPRLATRMRKSGVRTTDALLRKTVTKADRAAFAETLDVTPAELMVWVNRADLMRVKGIGGEYAHLLEAAGVDTVRELARRNPIALTEKMSQLNDKKRLVRRLPTEVMVAGWVAHATALPPVVKG